MSATWALAAIRLQGLLAFAEAGAESGNYFRATFLPMLGLLAKGFCTTFLIFALTVLFSLPLGLGICSLRMSRFHSLAWVARIYISVMRGTPLMLQLLVVFFGPYFLFGLRLGDGYRFPAVIIAFTLNYAAYFAEIYRGGIESIPLGQYEAANVLGYSRLQTFFRIILPQVVKRTLPPVTNEVITLTKDTSLAQVIACLEMFTVAKELAASMVSMVPYLAAGLFYYIFNFLVAWAMEGVERKFSYYR